MARELGKQTKRDRLLAQVVSWLRMAPLKILFPCSDLPKDPCSTRRKQFDSLPSTRSFSSHLAERRLAER